MAEKFTKIITLADKQQGIWSEKSCIDAVNIIHQIFWKPAELNKRQYLCMQYLKKALHNVRLQNVLHILQEM